MIRHDFEVLYAQNWVEQVRAATIRDTLVEYHRASGAVLCADWSPGDIVWERRLGMFHGNLTLNMLHR